MTIDRRALVTVAGLYVASQLMYGLLGLRFDAWRSLVIFQQFIDVDLLSGRLLESLWFYHANPPLLNLLAGVGLKVFGDGAPAFFSIVFYLLGVALAFAVHELTRALTDSRLAAGIATALLLFSPSFALYQSWLMYSFIEAALLTVSAALLYRYVRSGTAGWAVAFFGALALLLLARSFFHLAWLVLVVGLLAVALRGRRRQVLACAALPVLIAALWYGKNWYVFGTFSSSTWFGLGLSNISTLTVTREELEPLVRRGELSKYALISRYKQLDVLLTERTVTTGVPVLDQVQKKTGHYNYNHLSFLALDPVYTADGLRVIRAFPASYGAGLALSNRLFFSPSSMNTYFSTRNREAVRPVEEVYNRVLYGVPGSPERLVQPHFGFTGEHTVEVNTSLPLILTWWLTLLYGCVQARNITRASEPAQEARAVVIGFIVLTALYVYVLGTAFELGENYRYRWAIEPLVLVLTIAGITHGLRLARERLARLRA